MRGNLVMLRTCMWGIIVTVILAGCSFARLPGEDPGPEGPLHMQVPGVHVENHGNLTIELAFQNKGPENLEKIYAVVVARVERANGSVAPGRIVDMPGKYFGTYAIFNHSDILRPGEWKNVTLHATILANFSEGDLYHVNVLTDAQDSTTRWGWTYNHPCLNTDGTVGSKAFPCRPIWRNSEPTHAEDPTRLGNYPRPT